MVYILIVVGGLVDLKQPLDLVDLFAHTIANDEPHKLNAAFNLNRFISGDLVDEHGAAAVAH